MRFSVRGRPKPWERTTHRTNPETGKIERHNTKEYEDAKERIAWAALAKRLPSWKTNRRYVTLVKAVLKNRRSEGDVDNYGKLPMDALQKILWDDDKQVGLLIAGKVIGDEPRTEIETHELEETAFGVLLNQMSDLISKASNLQLGFGSRECPICGGTGALVDEYGTKAVCCAK